MDLLTEKRSEILVTLINNGFVPPFYHFKGAKRKCDKIVEIAGYEVG